MIQYRYASMILCSVGEVIVFEHECYISALKHIRMLILSLILSRLNDLMISSERFNIQSEGSISQLWNTVGR